jgi:hypothetical protein
MDSLTQIALGGATAAVVAPRQHRRAALAAGAVPGTLPDLDIIRCSFLGLTRLLSLPGIEVRRIPCWYWR